MTRTRALALMAFVAALAVGGWLLASDGRFYDDQSGSAQPASSPTPLISSSEVDLAGLQSAATESCKCERSDGGEASCWGPYRSARSDIEARIYGNQAGKPEVFGYATACDPVSTETDCFEFADGESCVVTGYSVSAASEEYRDVMVCTAGEAQAIEAAFSDAWRENGRPVSSDDQVAYDRANKRADAAIADVLARIRGGEEFDPELSSDGCV